jgi:hypothetical protein
MPTSEAVRTEVADFLATLLQDTIAIATNPVVNDGERVSWPRRSSDPRFLRDVGALSINDYRWWLENSYYSAVLFDGSLLQISYEFLDRQLSGHRLAFIPCPFQIDREVLEYDPFVDIFDRYAQGPADSVVPRSPIRFDFDSVNAQPGHPVSHLTLNAAECRVPCASPMRLGLFVDFVFRHFYPRLAQEHPWLLQLPQESLGAHTVTEDEQSRIHISWPRIRT